MRVTLKMGIGGEGVAMCEGDRLIADFVAGTETRPDLPEKLAQHLTTTVTGQWVVWAYKVARPEGDLFVPLTGGAGYPADARAECRRSDRAAAPADSHRLHWRRRAGLVPRGHDAPEIECTCGFHALSSRTLPRLPIVPFDDFAALSVVLSGRVLAFEWRGGGVLWRAERQTVVHISRSVHDWMAQELWDRPLPRGITVLRRDPDDPDGGPAIVRPAGPRDSGPIRLDLPVFAPVLPVCHDDAGWCAAPGAVEHQLIPADVLSLLFDSDSDGRISVRHADSPVGRVSHGLARVG
jgi:hypothetical protein